MNRIGEGSAEWLHRDITERIIGCAFNVYNAPGFGFLESVYEKALAIELRKAGMEVELQHPIPVKYDGQPIGLFFADAIVNKAVLLELKSVRAINEAHETHAVHYLTATGIEVALIINFGEQRVEVKRKLRTLPSRSSCKSCPP